MDPKKKIEIINVDLNINLEEEIKKYSQIDLNTKTKIDTILQHARDQQKLTDKSDELWKEKFEKLFSHLSTNNSVSKSDMINILEIPTNRLAASISRFKKFLYSYKNNQWTIVINSDKQNRTYALKRIS